MITWITESLAIGDFTDTLNLDLLHKEKVDSILFLDSKEKSRRIMEAIKGEIDCSWYPVLTDPIENIWRFQDECQAAYDELSFSLSIGMKVLVSCIAGIDRSPFIVAMYLTKHCFVSYEDKLLKAYSLIKEKRPWIIEHYDWWNPLW